MADSTASAEAPRSRRSILLNGNFNPAIFQPQWLVQHDIIDSLSDATSESAENDVLVSAVVAMVKTPSLTVQVTHDRALLRSRRTAVTPADIAARAMAALRVLPHTPIRSVEIVSERHADPSVLAWESVWPRLLRQAALSSLLPDAAGSTISMERDNADGSWQRITLEPSRHNMGAPYLRAHVGLRIAESPLGTAETATAFIDDHQVDAEHLADHALAALEELIQA